MFPFNYLSLAAAAMLAPSVAHADDLVFSFENQTSYAIVELYASPSNVEGWEEDILGRDILEAGEAASVTIADGRRACEYDLRVVFEDGDVIEDTTDLCETESYTITE